MLIIWWDCGIVEHAAYNIDGVIRQRNLLWNQYVLAMEDGDEILGQNLEKRLEIFDIIMKRLGAVK